MYDRSTGMPFWVRALRQLDRAVMRGYRLHALVASEIFVHWVNSATRGEMTRAAYAADRQVYLPGGATFEAGLFDWEGPALARMALPHGARVLLGAAGGGRELRVLLERGYEVASFEPNEALLSGAIEIARQYGAPPTQRATYSDLVRSVETARGPLAELEPGFDAVIFGWASFSHVLEPLDQAAILRATNRLAPKAPILLSFFHREERERIGDHRGQVLRKGVRSLAQLAGRDPAPDGLRYQPRCGFFYRYTEAEIQALALGAGYRVGFFTKVPYAHAIFVPAER